MFKSLRERWKERTSSAPDFSPEAFDPFDHSFITAPHPRLAALRDAGIFRCQNGSWIVSRHQDVTEALAHPALLNSPSNYAVLNERNSPRYICAAVANNTLPFLDAPAHTELRKHINRQFQAQLRSQALNFQQIAEAKLLATSANKHTDLLSDFASPLCIELICQLLGFEPPDTAQTQQLKQWSSWFFYLFSIIPSETVRAELDVALDAFRAYCEQQIALACQNHQSDFINELRPLLSAEQLLDNCLLLVADAANADYAIANAMRLILSSPSLLSQLRNDNCDLESLADELLRYDSPSLFIARRTASEVTLAGTSIPANSGVLLMLAAANHDSAVFPHPEKIDVNRARSPYLSFGKGGHACVGRALVRKLMVASLYALQHFPGRLAIRGEIIWEHRAGHRWLRELNVEFSPARG